MKLKWFYHFWHYIRRIDAYSNELKKNPNRELKPNIYDAGPDLKTYIQKHRRIHAVFKYLILKPILYILKKGLGKHLETSVPNKTYYKNLLVFDKAFERSLVEWCDKCLGSTNTDTPNQSRERIEASLNTDSVEMLRLMKQIVLTVVRNDTAYLDFFSMLLINISIDMGKTHGKNAQHIIYNSGKIEDAKYFLISGFLNSLDLKEIKDTYNQKKEDGNKKIKTKD